MSRPDMSDRIKRNISLPGTTDKLRIAPKLRRSETTYHRAYYLDKEVVKALDKVAKKYGIDKSRIVENALKEYIGRLDT